MPGVTPNTAPDVALITATDGLLLAHVPPVVLLLNVVADPAQTVPDPMMPGGTGFTVTARVLLHPLPTV